MTTTILKGVSKLKGFLLLMPVLGLFALAAPSARADDHHYRHGGYYHHHHHWHRYRHYYYRHHHRYYYWDRYDEYYGPPAGVSIHIGL